MEVHLVPQIFGRGEVHCQNDGLYDVRLAIVRRLILKKRQRSQSLSRVTKKSGLSSFAPSGPASSALTRGRHCAGHSALLTMGFALLVPSHHVECVCNGLSLSWCSLILWRAARASPIVRPRRRRGERFTDQEPYPSHVLANRRFVLGILLVVCLHKSLEANVCPLTFGSRNALAQFLATSCRMQLSFAFLVLFFSFAWALSIGLRLA